jgi:aconitate hydratase
MQYHSTDTPLLVLAGKEYGSGSSRDWAAKGPYLLGVKAVVAQSFERIHRSNLIGMGILPLEFVDGQSTDTLGLSGHESFSVLGLTEAFATNFSGGKHLTVRAEQNGETKEFQVQIRIDTPQEALYYRHGGILQYVLRSIA